MVRTTTGEDPGDDNASVPEPQSSDAPSVAALPDNLTLSVELPAQHHEAPEDEVQVALGEVVTTPSSVAPVVADGSGTVSIEVVSDVVHTADDDAAPSSEIPIVPLPGDDELYSRRGRGRPGTSPEPAAMLTPDRLLEPKRNRTAPEGGWPAFVYASTLHLVNLGDSPKVRARKALDARIAKRFEGGTRFVPVLTRKGGVGKTTITTLIGMALSDVREDRIIAVDANPDRGTLSERVARQTRSTVRDIVTHAAAIKDFSEFSSHVSRDETRLDVLASDTDPLLSEAFDENDYNVVADLVSRYYSIALTDCGTGIVHSVMRATLQRADSIVIVSGGSVDEARLASETLTWLEANNYGHLVRNAVVAINTATHGTNLVKLDEIDAHFSSRVRAVVRMPYDAELAAGSVIRWSTLKPFTRESARELAAIVMDGIPTTRTS
ncbi:MinD/ParA family protein [Homoserinibacter sp. GY 40078]|uniref:MinD/ParA family ATP-binding protein n=1 Tax=Homoserinibacter sp. GY 40078 TaxID=2603275 RepID=UPI0011C97E60|nr:MinD/ParA family protein [Homoserinibacter sp. GY 40078]TXK17704.1 MinD/ParA family protein [Homoserinibacter sp. GY 40078]